MDVCSGGTSQSPIDIDMSLTVDRPADDISVTPWGLKNYDDEAELKMYEKARTLKITFPNNNLNGHFTVHLPKPYSGESYMYEDFLPQQFHFHSPSEHTVNGKHHDLEMHIVNSDESINHSVVGIFWNVGEHSDFIESLGLSNSSPDGEKIRTSVAFKDLIDGIFSAE